MELNRIIQGDCLEAMRAMPDDSVDLVFGSPPYAEKGERYEGNARKWKLEPWIGWMLECTRQAVRISRGWTLWVVNGAVRDGIYHPACEGLIYEAFKAGIWTERPVIWHKNAAPSRAGKWFSNDWEYVVAFKSMKDPYFDWQAIAEPPKYTNGGHFRQRGANGKRRRGSDYPQNKLARPRDVIRVLVGGGLMGSDLAHENEAPFPLKLAEKFVLACCPPDGTVLDPFSGSGTTAAAAVKAGRKYLAIDVRESQVELTKRRLAAVKVTA